MVPLVRGYLEGALNRERSSGSCGGGSRWCRHEVGWVVDSKKLRYNRWTLDSGGLPDATFVILLDERLQSLQYVVSVDEFLLEIRRRPWLTRAVSSRLSLRR